MLVRTFGMLLLLGLAGTAAWKASPALRTQVAAYWGACTGWTDAARQADPAGFASHVEVILQHDLAKMEQTRRDLAAEVERLAKTTREQSALAEQARGLADQFRAEYQQAAGGGSFPIVVRGAAYTEIQVRSQVSLLLAEAEGYAASLAELATVQATAGTKLEELAVRINRTEAQLAAVAAKRELLRAQQLTAAGEQLLAQVDELLAGNRQTVATNPVATVRELLARTPAPIEGRASDRKVEEFLAARLVSAEAVATGDELLGGGQVAPASRETPEPAEIQDKLRRDKRANPVRDKPIFQQG